MNSQLSQRDWDQLSSYLDGNLTPRVQAQLEQRLKLESALAEALHKLKATQALLRKTPQRRLRRSFIVTREMLGQSRSAPLAGWNNFNLVSAAASLLLVVALLGDFSLNGLPTIGAGAPETFMLESAPVEEGDAFPDAFPTEGLTLPAEDQIYADRMAQKTGFDARAFFAQNVRLIEYGLALVAALAGLIAILQRRKT